MEEYLNILNEEQLQAVKHTSSPLLILAGAGSGKTRVITTKIAYLISQCKIKPSSILAVTFTKKAAKEMQDRAEKIEKTSVYSHIRTFHSFGAWFLRVNSQEAGLDPNFTVYDDEDMVTLVTKAIKNLSRQQAVHIAKKISLAKDYCLTPEDTDKLLSIDQDPDFSEYYNLYEKYLQKTGNVDFGDLILKPVILLKENPSLKSYMHQKFKVIMVDEYQDSNVAQFQLLQQLVGEDTYVCVVGDDDQSIYKFRGAEVKNILDFEKHFPNTTVIKLERNYRSFSPILTIADSVVKHNKNRLGKTLISHRGLGPKPNLIFLPNQDEETKFCASLIKEAAKQGVPYSDWAILYRTNAQSLGFESEFLHKKIPYTIVGSLKFYEREEIKDLLAYLSFIINNNDEIAFRRIINKPARSLGQVTQEKIIFQFRSNPDKRQNYSLLDAALDILPKLPKKAKEGLNEFIELIQNIHNMLPNIKDDSPQSFVNDIIEKQRFFLQNNLPLIDEVVQDIVENNNKKNQEKTEVNEKLSVVIEKVIEKSGLKILYSEIPDEIASTQKLANMQELVNSAVLYDKSVLGLINFLDHIELDRTLENQDSQEDSDAVTLITVHNTKGLEFSRVIMTGLEYGVFPRKDKINEEKEEERRLFYVGITRAKDILFLTSCSQRRLYGKTDFMDVSPFLLEFDSNDVEIIGKIPPSFKRGSNNSFNTNDYYDEISQRWKVGTKIFHDEEGYGVIIKTKNDDEFVISVQYETGAIRRYMPKYQPNKLMIIKE